MFYLIMLFCVFSFLLEAKEETGKVDHYIALEADLVYLQRAKSDDRCLAKIDSSKANSDPTLPGPCGCPCSCKLTSRDALHDFKPAPGLRASALFMPNQDWSLEARFMGFFHWKGSKSTVCSGGLNFPFNPNTTQDYQLASAATVFYDTNFMSTDINYWRHVTPRRVNYFSVSWVAGIRYIQIDEEFKVTYRKKSDQSDYRVKTANHLFGVQLGGDLQVNPYKPLIWGMSGKIGLFGDYGHQASTLCDINNTILIRHFDPSGWNFCFLAEAAPFITLYFFPLLYVKISYELTFLNHLILAPQQMGITNSGSELNSDGRAIYHGIFAGLGLEF